MKKPFLDDRWFDNQSRDLSGGRRLQSKDGLGWRMDSVNPVTSCDVSVT